MSAKHFRDHRMELGVCRCQAWATAQAGEGSAAGCAEGVIRFMVVSITPSQHARE